MNDTAEKPAAQPVDPNLARYYALCDQRDAVNKANEPIEAELTKVNDQINALQSKALELANNIDEARGRDKWLKLKSEIAFLARGLGRIPPRAAAE